MKSNTPTFKDLDEKHNKLIRLFIDSIVEQIEPSAGSTITVYYEHTHQTNKKILKNILYNEKSIDIAQLYDNKKSTLTNIQKEFEKNLTDIGKDITKEFHTHMIEWNKQRDKMWNDLNKLYEQTKRNNAKYFILTQMTGD